MAMVVVEECDFTIFNPFCTNPPCHFINTDIYLGTGVTPDSINAETDADNGVLFPNDIRPNIDILLPVTMFNNTGNTSYLTGWIDWNGDGDFDDLNEQIANEAYDFATYNGSFQVSLQVTVPNDANVNAQISARFRYSTDDVLIISPCGIDACAADGEVEDYLIQVNCPPDVCLPARLDIIRE